MKSFFKITSLIVILLLSSCLGFIGLIEYKNRLNTSAILGDLDEVKRLLVDGEDINRLYVRPNDHYGLTPLEMAILARQTDVALFLINEGANLDISRIGSSSIIKRSVAIFVDQCEVEILNSQLAKLTRSERDYFLKEYKEALSKCGSRDD